MSNKIWLLVKYRDVVSGHGQSDTIIDELYDLYFTTRDAAEHERKFLDDEWSIKALSESQHTQS